MNSISKYQKRLKANLRNIPGWRTKKRIIVFESDDWGSIRMHSAEDKRELEKLGFDFTNQEFNTYDALESNDDLSQLFEVLSLYKDEYGNHPVITAASIVGNPDFKRIKESGFQKYYWESMSETCKRYPNHDKVCDLYKYGIEKHLFYPIFHGREHLNVQRWLRLLREGNKSILYAFEHEVTGISKDVNGKSLLSMQAAFDLDNIEDIQFMREVIKEGTVEFERLWGYRARYFVPTNGPFNNALEFDLKHSGIDYILGERVQKEPQGYGKYKKHYHWIGKKNNLNQIYLTRNGFFEPSVISLGFDYEPIERCLKNIEDAFYWHKPAIISSHRLNYIGSIEKKNQEKNIELFDKLLKKILQKWPDVMFVNSVQLGDLINNDKE